MTAHVDSGLAIVPWRRGAGLLMHAIAIEIAIAIAIELGARRRVLIGNRLLALHHHILALHVDTLWRRRG